MHVPHVASREKFSIHSCSHVQIESSGPHGFVLELICGNEPWSQGGREVLGFSRAKTNLHLPLLDVPSAPVVHDGIPGNEVLSLILGNVCSTLSDHARDLQF